MIEALLSLWYVCMLIGVLAAGPVGLLFGAVIGPLLLCAAAWEFCIWMVTP